MKEINYLEFKVWVQTRLEPGHLYGFLEFPGGKIEKDETPEIAARREVLEEVGVDLPSDQPLKFFKCQVYEKEEKIIFLHVFLSSFNQLPPDKGQWLSISFEKKSSPYFGLIPPVNHFILDELALLILKKEDQTPRVLL